MSSSSASDSEPELSEESQCSGDSSSVEEIPRLPTKSRRHDGYPADVVFADSDYETDGDHHHSRTPGLPYSQRKRTGKHTHMLTLSSRRTDRVPESSGSENSDTTDNHSSDTDTVIPRHKRRRSPRRPTSVSRSRKRFDSEHLNRRSPIAGHRHPVESSEYEDDNDSDLDFLSFKRRRVLKRRRRRSLSRETVSTLSELEE
ncbi:hypothetical protein V8E54_000183 [Elaphomyces granulatus]